MGNKNRMENRKGMWNIPSVSGLWLKNFAVLTLLLQAIAVAVIENGVIHLGSYTQQELSDAMEASSKLVLQAGIASVLEFVGGLAIPVLAFLLVEGYLHTLNFRKYLLRMAAFAVISEIPYDFAWRGKWVDWSSQNILVTLSVCLVMLYCLDFLRKQMKGMAGSLLSILVVICGIAWTAFLHAQFGLVMILLTAILFVFHEKSGIRTVMGLLVCLFSTLVNPMYVTGMLSFYAIGCYNGAREDRWPKYVYYILYPVMLLLLGIAARML